MSLYECLLLSTNSLKFMPNSLTEIRLQIIFFLHRGKIQEWTQYWWSTSQGAFKKSHAQWHPSLCQPMDYSPPGSSVHGILQARILEWIAIPFSRESSWLRDGNQVCHIAGRFFTTLVPREALWHREPCSVFCNDLNEKMRICKRRDTCICLPALCYTPETNTLLINYTPI